MTSEPNKSRDLELAKRCIAGEESAWRRLTERTVPAVSRMIRRTLERFGHPSGAGEVEGMAGEVYARLWERDCRLLRKYRGTCTLTTWVVGLARLHAIEQGTLWRERTRKARESAQQRLASFQPYTDQALSELQEEVRQALGALPEADRRILQLLYEENRNYRQIARELRLPWTTLASRIARLKDRVATLLRDRLFCL